MQKQLAILNFEECSLQKLIYRVRNYLDWMSISDQQAWKNTMSDYMDIDSIIPMLPKRTDSIEVDNMGTSNEQIILPGNRINWSQINNTNSLLVAWRCLMRHDNRLRSDCLRWLNQ